jgi:hypothetical protein
VDRKTGSLVDRNSGRSFSMGDRVEVTITAVDLARREMEVIITDAASRDVGKTKSVAAGLKLGDAVEEFKPRKTGAEKRAQRSRSRDKRKQDFRGERKDKGKRQ